MKPLPLPPTVDQPQPIRAPIVVLQLVARLPDGREIPLQTNSVDLSQPPEMVSYAIRGHGECMVHESDAHAQALLLELDRKAQA